MAWLRSTAPSPSPNSAHSTYASSPIITARSTSDDPNADAGKCCAARKSGVPAPSRTVAMAHNAIPNAPAVTSFAAITRPRRGVTRNVDVMVPAANSLVTTCAPSIRVMSTSRNCPEVIMLAAIAPAPEAVRADAACASTAALPLPE